jgi:hypothetical protein
MALRSDGLALFSAYKSTSGSGVVMDINRTSTDGGILGFRKDGTTVGSIGSYAGAHLRVGSGEANLLFAGADEIVPATSSGSASNGLIDLGSSARRFKDLYLSGGVYLGGTGAANKLDDYEEGTWTPTVEFGGVATGITYTAQHGSYTKIGDLITVTGYIVLANKGSAAGVFQIHGLPFTVKSGNNSIGSFSVTVENVTYVDQISGYVPENVAYLRLFESVSGGALSSILNTDIANNSNFRLTATYKV